MKFVELTFCEIYFSSWDSADNKSSQGKVKLEFQQPSLLPAKEDRKVKGDSWDTWFSIKTSYTKDSFHWLELNSLLFEALGHWINLKIWLSHPFQPPRAPQKEILSLKVRATWQHLPPYQLWIYQKWEGDEGSYLVVSTALPVPDPRKIRWQ